MLVYRIAFSAQCLLTEDEQTLIFDLLTHRIRTNYRTYGRRKTYVPRRDSKTALAWRMEDDKEGYENSIRNCILVEIDALKSQIRKNKIKYFFAECDLDVTAIKI